MSLRSVMVAAAAISALLATTPATAQELRVTDPAGDAEGPGLDIVAARVDNRDYRVIASVRVTEDVRGDVIVSVDRRHGTGVRMVHEHRPKGEDDSFVVPGAFSDSAPSRAERCPGFRARWLDDRPVVRMVLPARCLNSGSYGALRFAFLTEARDDTDYAPEEPDSSTAWIPRG